MKYINAIFYYIKTAIVLLGIGDGRNELLVDFNAM